MKHIHKAKYDEETDKLLDECAFCGEDFRNTDVHLIVAEHQAGREHTGNE